MDYVNKGNGHELMDVEVDYGGDRDRDPTDEAAAEEQNGNEALLVPVKTITTTMSHPLLMDHILRNVFQHLDNDRPLVNLTASRLVCQDWNTAAARSVKKSLRWKIGPLSSSSADQSIPARDEAAFMELVANCDFDLFRNFHLCASDTAPLTRADMINYLRNYVLAQAGQPNQYQIPEGVTGKVPTAAQLQFLETFGPSIVDLKINGGDSSYLDACLRHTPNLEYLHVYGLWVPPEADFQFVWSLPRMTHATINSPLLRDGLFHEALGTHLARVVRNKFGGICESLLNAAPKLTCLETNSVLVVRQSVLTLVDAEHPLPQLQLNQLAGLTTLKILDDTALTVTHLDSIREYCTGLRSFAAAFPANYGLDHEVAVLLLIHGFAPQLEDMFLKATTAYGSVYRPPLPRPAPRDRATPRPGFPYGYVFPNCPRLRRLVLMNWKMYNDFCFDAPQLAFLQTSVPVRPEPPMSPTPKPFPGVRTLRFTDFQVTGGDIKFLAELLPRVEELDCRLENDEALAALCECMPQMKRLNLTDSVITDAGITGLDQRDLDVITKEDWPFDGEFAGKVAASLKFPKRPGIGDLKDLESFRIGKNTGFGAGLLSKYSVYLGFVRLKELRDLKIQPFRRPKDQHIETVPARALADNCPVLAKLDVCGVITHRVPGQDFKPGCGLTDEVIEYVKGKLPYLQLVYDDAESLSDRLRAGKADRVVVL